MELPVILQELQKPLADADRTVLQQKLEDYINNLIHSDFNSLVQLLYAIDIDEQKLKATLLQQTNRDAAPLIAGMIVTRLKEKAASRNQFKPPDKTDSGDRW